MGPQDHVDREHRKAEELWKQKVTEALALLERNPDYPSVRGQIHDKDKEIIETTPAGAITSTERLSEERLEFLLKLLNVRGEAYMQLAVNLESVKAIEIVMREFARITWLQLADGLLRMEAVFPTSLFAEPSPIQRKRDRILRTSQDWSIKAYKHLASLTKVQQPTLETTALEDSNLVGSYPERAAWLKDRLKERGWDWNEPNRWGGPDRKTVQKILNGKFVRPDMLEKIIIALNHKKISKALTLLDIPSD